MFVTKRRIEATLFYHQDPKLALSQLADDLVQAFAKTSAVLRPRFVSKTELGCTIGGLTLSFLRHADWVSTPPLPDETDPNSKSIAYTLRISGPEHAAHISTRLSLCYVAVLQILNLCPADRIHWGYTNVVRTRAAFLLESSGRHMRPDAGPVKKAATKYAPERRKSMFDRHKQTIATAKDVLGRANPARSQQELIQIFTTLKAPEFHGASHGLDLFLPRTRPL